jgi:hypothetical protein
MLASPIFTGFIARKQKKCSLGLYFGLERPNQKPVAQQILGGE